MPEQFFDLRIEQQADGTIRLEQRDYCGESVCIDLHPLQAEHIAHGFGKPITLMPLIPNDLLRRMKRLREDADALYTYLASVPCFPPSSKVTEDTEMAGALLDDINALLEDLGMTDETDAVIERLATENQNKSAAHAQVENKGGDQLGLDV